MTYYNQFKMKLTLPGDSALGSGRLNTALS